MNILLIDCAFKKIEFAYNKKGNFIILNDLKPGENADSLVHVMKTAFDSAGCSLSEVDYVGLSNGPGSFTGIRVGSAIAKGICFAGKAKLVELVTLDILAGKFTQDAEGKIIMPLIYTYSGSGEYYTAEYRQTGEGPERISDYRIINPAEFGSGRVYLINENPGKVLPGSLEIHDISAYTGMNAMYEMTVKAVNGGRINDYMTSEPFYMKNMFEQRK
ncbi:MAG: tRNA (adenosine(37)-N6)-threonylcarbamoyltransferase complex dimerization subunit type 1 TsaB [Bacteroidetes bacterium]|nr:tRNA (adenosine(37)-N6)-threonylcarbamoyltransferase complex dimerization subunit type 1 TsaB [Bacteroidota bacterium]